MSVCNCIRTDCWHSPGPCDEPPTSMYGGCSTCRFHQPPEVVSTKSWLRGEWMQTFTGKRFYPGDPRAEDIDPTDIAHALSMLCRYAGHINRFYSVAEHCVLMSQAVAPEHALQALLHDATEAYVVDLPKPVKRLLPDYQAVEGRVWSAIAERFGVDPVIADEVHEADRRILVNEVGSLMPQAEAWDTLVLEPLPIIVVAWSPYRAEREYRQRLFELTGIKS